MKKILLVFTILFVSVSIADSSIRDSKNVQFTLDGTDAEVFDDSDDFKHAKIDSRDFDRAFRDPVVKKKARKRGAKVTRSNKRSPKKIAYSKSKKRVKSTSSRRIASATPRKKNNTITAKLSSKTKVRNKNSRSVSSIELSFFDKVVIRAQKGYVEAKKVAKVEYGKLLNKYAELKKRWISSK